MFGRFRPATKRMYNNISTSISSNLHVHVKDIGLGNLSAPELEKILDVSVLFVGTFVIKLM